MAQNTRPMSPDSQVGEPRKRAQTLSTFITMVVSDWPTPDSFQAKLNTDWLPVVAAELYYSPPSNTCFRQGARGTICLSTLGSDTNQPTPGPEQWQSRWSPETSLSLSAGDPYAKWRLALGVGQGSQGLVALTEKEFLSAPTAMFMTSGGIPQDPAHACLPPQGPVLC